MIASLLESRTTSATFVGHTCLAILHLLLAQMEWSPPCQPGGGRRDARGRAGRPWTPGMLLTCLEGAAQQHPSGAHCQGPRGGGVGGVKRQGENGGEGFGIFGWFLLVVSTLSM